VYKNNYGCEANEERRLPRTALELQSKERDPWEVKKLWTGIKLEEREQM
jgi:hypothetical protein